MTSRYQLHLVLVFCAACLVGSCIPSPARAQIVRSVSDAGEEASGHACRHCQPARFADPLKRTGHPFDIAPWAVVTPNRHYAGYYVGGGTALGGSSPHAKQGTWGIDYVRLLFWKRVDLRWSNGRRRQGGTGAYQSNGPHILPGH